MTTRCLVTGDIPEITDAGVDDDFTATDPALASSMVDALSPLLGTPNHAGESPGRSTLT